jgi:glucose-6-phosphate isomerase
MYFIDNTDPAGIADVKAVVDLAKTLVVSISKSGGTQETKNNLTGFEQAYAASGLHFADHAVAITMQDSKLDAYAKGNNWRKVFPMAESIGGRTSETNIVGHLPAALAGIDFAAFVEGAKAMDELTRAERLEDNPAYQLAVCWYLAGNGRGDRNMVVVPYSDRLVLLGKYLQQLVMESLGKELDLDGKVVHQGLTVYGNKGGTDAHAYIQQLNDGRDDFFVTFIEPLRDAEEIVIGDGLLMGDYLHGFKQGLVNALRGKGRQVIDLAVDDVGPRSLGMLIALYERAVAFYAELIHVNAFHQPGVQAYKLASTEVNDVNRKLQSWLAANKVEARAGEIAAAAGLSGAGREVAGVLARFAVNGREFEGHAVRREFRNGDWIYVVA